MGLGGEQRWGLWQEAGGRRSMLGKRPHADIDAMKGSHDDKFMENLFTRLFMLTRPTHDPDNLQSWRRNGASLREIRKCAKIYKYRQLDCATVTVVHSLNLKLKVVLWGQFNSLEK
ncbi:hypothetical protein V6N13_089537 [Hibiscus sabdariffa]